jgi:NAD-dependent SIR2 family protein deacetylase
VALLDRAVELLADRQKVVVFTGAGVSTDLRIIV